MSMPVHESPQPPAFVLYLRFKQIPFFAAVSDTPSPTQLHPARQSTVPRQLLHRKRAGDRRRYPGRSINHAVSALADGTHHECITLPLERLAEVL
jgi:hypothetical protein